MSAQREESLRRVRMSWEEFLDLPHPPKAEWVDGEVVIDMAPVVIFHGDAVGRLFLLLARCFLITSSSQKSASGFRPTDSVHPMS